MKPKTALGVTLIELLVVIAVLCIVLAVGAPSIIGMINRHRVELAMEQLASDLAYARSEAIAHPSLGGVSGVLVLVTPSSQCYTLAYGGIMSQCNCSYGVGNACAGIAGMSGAVELRTTQIPQTWQLNLTMPNNGLGALGNRWNYARLTGQVSPVNSPITISDHNNDASLQISVPSSLSPARICSPQGTIPGYAAC